MSAVVRTDDGVADDWPIDYETLEPLFALNDQMTGRMTPSATCVWPRTTR